VDHGQHCRVARIRSHVTVSTNRKPRDSWLLAKGDIDYPTRSESLPLYAANAHRHMQLQRRASSCRSTSAGDSTWGRWRRPAPPTRRSRCPTRTCSAGGCRRCSPRRHPRPAWPPAAARLRASCASVAPVWPASVCSRACLHDGAHSPSHVYVRPTSPQLAVVPHRGSLRAARVVLAGRRAAAVLRRQQGLGGRRTRQRHGTGKPCGEPA
jgi:hypothetical protein